MAAGMVAVCKGLARFLHQFFGAEQGGQVFRNAVERGMARVPRPVLFRALDFLPVRPNLVHVFDFRRPKNVRMTADEFFHEHAADFLEIKRAALARELAVENHLQQQIAEFLGHLVIVARLDGVNQFINLLDGMAAQRHVALLAVPRTARGRAQPRHDLQQFLDGWALLHSEKHRTSNIERRTLNVTRAACNDRNFEVRSSMFSVRCFIYKITRSSRWTSSSLGSLRARTAAESNRAMPRANSVPSRSQIRTTSPAANSPSQRATPGGRRLLPFSRKANFAPSSTNSAPCG